MPKPQKKSTGSRRPSRARPKPKARTRAGRKSSAGAVDENQLGTLMSKSLDLAEASLTLGMNFVQRLGSTVQEQVIGRLSQVGQSFNPPAPEAAPAEPVHNAEPEPRQRPATGRPFAGVANQQPLFPGSPIRVSFSINNDSQSSARKVALKLEGLKGEISGAALDAALTVQPPSATIVPMDFEKFILRGLVPMDARSDAYQGWIVVSGDEQLRIPLRLTITGRR